MSVFQQQRVAPSVMKMKTAASFKTSTHPAEVIKKLSNLFAMHGIKFAADTATYFIKVLNFWRFIHLLGPGIS